MRDLKSWIRLTDEPEVRARRRYLAKEFIEADPELKAEVEAEARRDERLVVAHRLLARMFALRKLVPTAEEQAHIDACTDIEAMERWHVQAVDAPTIAEALR